jgi:hypothetical protein
MFLLGVMHLPYVGINEPVTVWFDGVNNKEKVDYCKSKIKNIKQKYHQ